MKPPAYELRRHPLVGTRYVLHSIYVGGALVHEQIGPMSEEEIEQRIMAYLRNEPTRPVREVIYAKPGPKKSASVNERGFLWRDDDAG